MELMAAFGIPEDEMVRLLVNGKTQRPISVNTLRKHCSPELQRGMTNANVRVMTGMFKNATTATEQYPGGNPTIQIFWAKTRMGMREAPRLSDLEAPPDAEDMVLTTDGREVVDYDIARRIAFLLDVTPQKAKQKPR